MSNTQNSLPASVAEPASFDSVPSAPSALPDGERRGELGMAEGADSGGHNLLSRSSAPQGRRSLFRR